MVCGTLTPESWTTDYRVVKAVNSPTPQPVVTLATFVTEAGNPGAQLATSAPVTTRETPDVQSLERGRIQAQ